MTSHPTYSQIRESLETVVRKYNPFAPIIAEHLVEEEKHKEHRDYQIHERSLEDLKLENLE